MLSERSWGNQSAGSAAPLVDKADMQAVRLCHLGDGGAGLGALNQDEGFKLGAMTAPGRGLAAVHGSPPVVMLAGKAGGSKMPRLAAYRARVSGGF